MRTLVQAAWLACAAAFLAPALPRPAPRRATDSRIEDDYSDFDLNSASKPPEDADYVFPGALVQALAPGSVVVDVEETTLDGAQPVAAASRRCRCRVVALLEPL